MTDFRQDMARIQQLAGSAYHSAEGLPALTDGEPQNPAKFQQALEMITTQFERATLTLRALCETYRSGGELLGKKPSLPALDVAGSIDLIENQWLHIRLETLLPHCRYQTPDYLADTIRRLLDAFEARGQKLPCFRRALLVVDEHSSIDGRHVFDQDNKGWKAIPNALKGRVIPDDDQYSLGVALLSAYRPEGVCHITLMDMQDASEFFVLRSESYSMDSMYQGF